MANKKDLRAFARMDGSGRIIPGSTVLRRKKPKVGNWIELEHMSVVILNLILPPLQLLKLQLPQLPPQVNNYG